MQGCVSASRDNLGELWLQGYLNAPIWRFWLGADICGATVLGALMSSLDGIGRYYPLTLFAYANPGDQIVPPDIDAHEAWFKTAEDFLLATLDKDVSFETISSALDRLADPAINPWLHHRRVCRPPRAALWPARWATDRFPSFLLYCALPIISMSMPRQAFGGPQGAATTNRTVFVAGECLPRTYSRTCLLALSQPPDRARRFPDGNATRTV